jgi:hypothetical protein
MDQPTAASLAVRDVDVNPKLSGDLAVRAACLSQFEREHETLGDFLALAAWTATERSLRNCAGTAPWGCRAPARRV